MKLLQQFIGISKVAGVEFSLLGDGKFNCQVVVVEVNKNILKIEKKVNEIHDLTKLKELISTDIPLAISFTGRGIINKKVDGIPSESDDVLINEIFPNSKASDFFLQKFTQQTASFLSLIRKEVINNFFVQLNDIGFNTVSVGLGPFIAGNILKLINHEEGNLNLLNYNLVINNYSIVEIKSLETSEAKKITIGEYSIEPLELLAFSSAFSVLVGTEFSGLTYDEVLREKQEYIHKRIFKTATFSALLFFFFLLLINYLCYLNFKDKNSILSESAQLYQGSIKEMKELELKVEQKEYFLKQAGWLTIPKNSYYADEIASIIPSSIKLKELKINPVNEKLSKETKVLTFKKDTIYIIGNCQSPTVLNPWMEEFKMKDWINDIKNKGYSHDYKLKEGTFKFEATIEHE